MIHALVTQMLEALEHGYMVTGAHAKYTAAITAAREYLAQSVEPEVLMVDAAMVEMKNIVPPLRRSECLRLIRAAINATAHPPQPQVTTPAVSNDWLIRKEPNTKDKYYVAEGKPPANVLEIYEITGEKP